MRAGTNFKFDTMNINWHEARMLPAPDNSNEAKEAQESFKDEHHEMMDGRDLLFWHETTGQPLTWLMDNGNGIAPNIYNAIVQGGCNFDDVYHMQPEHPEPETETPDRQIGILEYHVLYHKFPIGENQWEYQIMVCDESQEIGWYFKQGNTELTFESIDQCNAISDATLIEFFEAKEKEYINL